MPKSARPDLHAAMQRGATPAAASAPPETAPRVGASESARPGRVGLTNITGYFPPEVKRQLRTLAAEQDTTVQHLLGQALNYLFAKCGKPELVNLAKK